MNKIQFGLTTAIGAGCLVVLVGNVVLSLGNKSAQGDVAMRQQYVQQSVQLESLYREIIRALAELGARNNDNAVKDMLNKHGISYNVNAPAVTSALPSAPAATKR